MAQAPKKAATVIREVEAEIADLAVRIEQEEAKRQAALLADDTRGLDQIELTLERLRKTQGHRQERLRLWHQQAEQEEQAAVQKRRQALRERWARKASERGDLAVEVQTTVANLVVLMRKMTKISEDLRAAWPTHNSHTDLAAGSPEGAALSGSAIRALLSFEFYRISADPFLGGQPGERRQLSLPGAVCPRLDWQLTPDKITPFADAIHMANKFGVETMGTTLDPLKAQNVAEVVASVDGERTDKEQQLAALLAKQAQLAMDVSPAGEAAYMENLAAITRLSEPTGANNQ